MNEEDMQDELLILKIGKYRNKHIYNVNNSDPRYVQWLSRQPKLLTQYQRDYIEKKIILDENEYTFRFGKHRGKSLNWVKDNDSNYIDWLLKQNWVRENCLRLHQLLMEDVIEDKR